MVIVHNIDAKYEWQQQICVMHCQNDQIDFGAVNHALPMAINSKSRSLPPASIVDGSNMKSICLLSLLWITHALRNELFEGQNKSRSSRLALCEHRALHVLFVSVELLLSPIPLEVCGVMKSNVPVLWAFHLSRTHRLRFPSSTLACSAIMLRVISAVYRGLPSHEGWFCLQRIKNWKK